MIDAQAYVLREKGVIPELEDVQVSDELSVGQVLLRVLYSGLCATQMEEIFVASRNAKYMPHLFGHEGVGVIQAVGPGVETKQVGETCVIHWRQSSVGLDAEPGHYYFSNGQKISSGKVVTFSTQVVVPENRITHCPNGVAIPTAPVLGCSLPTGWGSVVRVGKVRLGDVVIVVGLGAVGTSAARVALAAGASKVIVVEPREVDPPMLNDPLVVHFSSVDDMGLWLELQKHSGEKVLAIDTSGSPSVIESLLEQLKPESRLVLVGMPKEGGKVRLDTQKLLDGLRITGSNGGDFDPARDLLEITRLSETSSLADFMQETNLVGIGSLGLALNLQRNSRKKQILDLSTPQASQKRGGA